MARSTGSPGKSAEILLLGIAQDIPPCSARYCMGVPQVSGQQQNTASSASGVSVIIYEFQPGLTHSAVGVLERECIIVSSKHISILGGKKSNYISATPLGETGTNKSLAENASQ